MSTHKAREGAGAVIIIIVVIIIIIIIIIIIHLFYKAPFNALKVTGGGIIRVSWGLRRHLMVFL